MNNIARILAIVLVLFMFSYGIYALVKANEKFKLPNDAVYDLDVKNPKYHTALSLNNYPYEFMLEYAPMVSDVHILDKNAVAKKSLHAAGMLTPHMMQSLNPHASFKSESGYEAEKMVVNDILEQQTNQQLARTSLAAALAGYIPHKVEDPDLWTRRTMLKDLHQPGLKPYAVNYSRVGLI